MTALASLSKKLKQNLNLDKNVIKKLSNIRRDESFNNDAKLDQLLDVMAHVHMPYIMVMHITGAIAKDHNEHWIYGYHPKERVSAKDVSDIFDSADHYFRTDMNVIRHTLRDLH